MITLIECDVLRGEETYTQTLWELLALTPKTLLYFYPKDNTPGCTIQAQNFSAYRATFAKHNIDIIGVSKDSLASHKTFHASCNLDITLIADTSQELIRAFGVIGEKNMYGKTITGLIRSTFLLDKDGNILREWRNVRAKWHVQKVLRNLKITT